MSPNSSMELSLNTRARERHPGLRRPHRVRRRRPGSTTPSPPGLLKHSYVQGQPGSTKRMLSYQRYHYNPVATNPDLVNRFFGFGCCAQIGGQHLQPGLHPEAAVPAERPDLFRAAGGRDPRDQGRRSTSTSASTTSSSRTRRTRGSSTSPGSTTSQFPQRVEFQAGDARLKTSNTQLGALPPGRLEPLGPADPLPRRPLGLRVGRDQHQVRHPAGRGRLAHQVPEPAVPAARIPSATSPTAPSAARSRAPSSPGSDSPTGSPGTTAPRCSAAWASSTTAPSSTWRRKRSSPCSIPATGSSSIPPAVRPSRARPSGTIVT